jgi:hypothetical protein
VARSALARGRKRDEARPAARILLLLGQPAAEQDQGVAHFVMRSAYGMALDERGGCLTERAGVDLLRNRLDPPIAIQLDGDGDPAAAGR